MDIPSFCFCLVSNYPPYEGGVGGCSIGFDIHDEQVKSLLFLMEHPPGPLHKGDDRSKL